MNFIAPSWPAPQQVKAITTCRDGGVSQAGFSSFNLAMHVGDEDDAVSANRSVLSDELGLATSPVWLEQIHGAKVVELNPNLANHSIQADASIARSSGVVCAVMTADCLPVLLCKEDGSAVAAIHAGWRGLLTGVIENAVMQLGQAENSMAWLGPAIGPGHFEVGEEVKQAFVNKHWFMKQGFRPVDSSHYLADLYALARMTLLQCGVKRIYGGEHCTYNQPNQFYSYRREPITGRMASLIWLQP